MKTTHCILTIQGLLIICDVNMMSGNVIKVDGAWSSWRKHNDTDCLESCTRQVFRIRDCDDPPPSVTGTPCTGSQGYAYEEKCVGGKCVEGKSPSQIQEAEGFWGEWRSDDVDACPATCRRMLTLRRNCSGPTRVTACTGTWIMLKMDYCKGDDCTEVDGGWTPWHPDSVQEECSRDCSRKLRFTRTCTNPAPAGRGKGCHGPISQEVKVDCTGGRCETLYGSWSVWERTTTGICVSNCSHQVTLSRRCTPRLLSACDGEAVVTVREECVTDECDDPVLSSVVATRAVNEKRGDLIVTGCVVIGSLCVMVVAVIAMIIRMRPKSELKMITIGDQETKDYKFQYDNPVFLSESAVSQRENNTSWPGQ
ncbi:hemicentin-1-like [Gigantopelta aegis]|uniref:hemicentin-1-like n=1 Tax=Gigantopelta aegis TaxID=1735272 RepID=UPI001B88E6CA|nr:hemicentin-1-like [Gigantopelta aegis]XP_041356565.1 hemicentin-1-like [Gigantopelta aegis]